MTALDRIRRFLAGTRRRGPLRILLTAGNPLGDAVGDTVMATRHVPFLSQLEAGARIRVWTGAPDIWRALAPEVEPIAMPRAGDLAKECDVAVFECARVPPLLVEALVGAEKVVMAWHAWDERMRVTLGSRHAFDVPATPLVNRTIRIDEMYEALGCERLAAPRSQTAKPSRRVFFNPYASSGAKSLSAPFCKALLAALLRSLTSDAEIAVPAVPRGRTSDDDERYRELGRLVSAAACHSPAIVTLAPLSIAEYVDAVARAALVIGADTSSQHVAATFGRASIACYPPYVGLPFYLYWGPVTANALHFLVPDDRAAREQRGLARLVAEAAAALVATARRGRATADPSRVVCGRAAERFLYESRRYLTGAARTRRSLLAALRLLDEELPASWKAHLLPELVEVYRTLPAVRRRPWRGDRRTALVRLPHLNSPKTLQLLGRS